MRKYRKHLLGSAALVLVAAVAGCGSGKGSSSPSASKTATGSSKQYAELRWGMTPFPGPIYYRYNLDQPAGVVAALSTQGLVNVAPDGKSTPGLAQSIEHPNPTTYIYKLRSAVRFSDGKPVTVADAVYSLERNLVGKKSETRSGWEEAVSSIQARGNSAVVVKLKRPDAVWPAIFAYSDQIIEKTAAEKAGENIGAPGSPAIGTGPWKIDSYVPEAKVQFSRNPYWSGPPQPAQRITIDEFKTEAAIALALRSGAIDGSITDNTPKTFANIPGIRQLTSPGAYFALLGLNTQLGPLKDVHVRRAIAYAINVEGMINALYAGHATEIVTPLPTDVDANLGSSSEVNAMLSSLPNYKFDLAAAKRELAKSAYPHGFTTSIELSAGGADGVVAQIIAADLAKIGITMKVDELQSSTLFGDLAAGTLTNELVVGYYPVYNDPQSILAELLLTKEIGPKGPGYNFAKYESPEVDNLLTKETESTTPQERLQVLGKALRIVASEAPYRPLFTYDAFEALSEKYVFPTFSPWTILFTPWALDVKLAK